MRKAFARTRLYATIDSTHKGPTKFSPLRAYEQTRVHTASTRCAEGRLHAYSRRNHGSLPVILEPADPPPSLSDLPSNDLNVILTTAIEPLITSRSAGTAPQLPHNLQVQGIALQTRVHVRSSSSSFAPRSRSVARITSHHGILLTNTSRRIDWRRRTETSFGQVIPGGWERRTRGGP